MAGRPPKPTALKLLQGNPGKRKLPAGEPVSAVGAICPAWLGAEAREMWKKWAPIFEGMGCLREADTLAFANWMALQARIKACEEAGEALSLQALKLAQSYAVQFGATPSGRARVSVEPKKPESKLQRFMDAGAKTRH